MSCVKNCEKETPEVNTRPIGLDFGLPWLVPPVFQDSKNLAVSQVETNFWMGALLTILQGSVLLHYMPRILYDLGLDPTIATAAPSLSESFYTHALATVTLLAIPGLLSLFVDELAVPMENAYLSLRRAWGKPTDRDRRDQAMIIETYEAIQMADASLQDILEELDPDGDGMVSTWEVQRALEELQLPVSRSDRLLQLIRQRNGRSSSDGEPLSTGAFLDAFQQLYVEARGNDKKLPGKVHLETTKTFVELFNELDKDGDGFIMPGDFDYLIDRSFRIKRTWEDKLELFRSADVIGQGRLNLFEFMTMMRKIAQAGIQEIGYGYLPLA
jgi:Ca2+-binding EF-hand superfamily protein